MKTRSQNKNEKPVAEGTVSQMKVSYNNKSMFFQPIKVVRVRFENISVAEARRAGNHYSNFLKTSRQVIGRLTTSMQIPKLGFRTSEPVEIGEHISLYDAEDYDSWKTVFKGKSAPYHDNTILPIFDLYIYQDQPKPKAGKENENNTHCFYDCIKTLFPNNKIPDCKGPKRFKMKFNVEPEDGIDISLIPKIEKKLKVKINVIGDHIYTSNSTATKSIRLLLKNGHYTVVKPKCMKLPKGWTTHERTPIAYYRENDTFLCYDGEKKFNLTLQDVQKIKSDKYNSKYMFIPRKKNDIEHLESELNEFIEIANDMKKATNGKINMYKTGSSFKQTSDYIFYKMLETRDLELEKCEQDESEWIEDCYNGGRIYIEKSDVEYKKLHKFDFCSEYPSILTTKKTFPIKRGEFKFVSDEIKNKKFFPKGIFRAIVEPGNKVFQYNPKNKYVNDELNFAKNTLNLKVTIIEDGNYNYLEYTNDKCVQMTNIFGNYIKYVFDLKQKGVKGAKQILTIPWGSSVQKKKFKKYAIWSEQELKLNPKDNVKRVQTVSSNTVKVTLTDDEDIYYGSFPRLLPFLTALGRIKVYEVVHDKMDSIKMILTDGFLTTNKDQFEIIPKQGAELGQLVYEGYYKNITLKSTNTSYKDVEFVNYEA